MRVAVAPVAEAIVWLARRKLLYTDLREPNVRIRSGGGGGGGGAAGSRAPSVALIDYDDMVLLDAAPASVGELRARRRAANRQAGRPKLGVAPVLLT